MTLKKVEHGQQPNAAQMDMQIRFEHQGCVDFGDP
jgi:hypothetical protein